MKRELTVVALVMGILACLFLMALGFATLLQEFLK
jgi:hypothetical protein